MNKIRNIIILLTLLICFIFVSMSSYANTVSSDLSNNFFRLHIIANSDSNVDQELKLKVRDSIISYINTLEYQNLSKEQIISLTKENLEELQDIVNECIKSNGFNYTCNLEIGNFYFPTKYYGNISLPAGYYDGLKINIGNAEGKNWWCSLYPPLCFTDMSTGVIDDTGEKILKNNLTNDEYLLITKGDEKIKIKFKIVEILGNLK